MSANTTQIEKKPRFSPNGPKFGHETCGKGAHVCRSYSSIHSIRLPVFRSLENVDQRKINVEQDKGKPIGRGKRIVPPKKCAENRLFEDFVATEPDSPEGASASDKATTQVRLRTQHTSAKGLIQGLRKVVPSPSTS